jgi:hypothetical protein
MHVTSRWRCLARDKLLRGITVCHRSVHCIQIQGTEDRGGGELDRRGRSPDHGDRRDSIRRRRHDGRGADGQCHCGNGHRAPLSGVLVRAGGQARGQERRGKLRYQRRSQRALHQRIGVLQGRKLIDRGQISSGPTCGCDACDGRLSGASGLSATPRADGGRRHGGPRACETCTCNSPAWCNSSAAVSAPRAAESACRARRARQHGIRGTVPEIPHDSRRRPGFA